MLKRSSKLLMAAVHQSFIPLRRDILVNSAWMACSITLAIFIAKSAHLPAPYWAGISAMMVIMPTFAAMMRKGLMRLFGTYIGAACGLLIVKFAATEPWIFFGLLFITIVGSLAWMQRARYPYACLIGGITCNMVMLAGLADPAKALGFAQLRALEITIGSVTSVALYGLISLTGKSHYVVEATDRRKRPSHALAGSKARAALVAGFAGCTAVGLWFHFHFTGIEQSITSVWVLSFSGTAFDTYHKGFQRFGGCLAGGIIAAMLMLIPTPFPVFLLLVFCWCLMCGVIQNGPIHGRYFGLQSAFAFLIVYANTEGPDPALFRLMSIVLGLVLVVLFSVLLSRVRLPALRWR